MYVDYAFTTTVFTVTVVFYIWGKLGLDTRLANCAWSTREIKQVSCDFWHNIKFNQRQDSMRRCCNPGILRRFLSWSITYLDRWRPLRREPEPRWSPRNASVRYFPFCLSQALQRRFISPYLHCWGATGSLFLFCDPISFQCFDSIVKD